MQLGEFCLRALICPTSEEGGSVWIGAHPSTEDALKTRLGDNFNTNQTPQISLQVVFQWKNINRLGLKSHIG